MVDKKKLIKGSIDYLKNPKQSYSEADKIVYRLQLEKLGIQTKGRRSGLKIVVGGVLVGVGLITFPFPTGSIFMIGAGCSLMISGGLDLWGYYRKAKRKAVFIIWRIKENLRLKKERATAIISKLPFLNLRNLKGGLN